MHLIPSWDAVKDEVSRIVSKFSSSEPRTAGLLPAIEASSHESLEESRESLEETSTSGYQMTLPHGFQKLSSLYHPLSNLDSALYIPGNRKVRIATKDNHHVQLFEGDKLLARHDTHKSKGDIASASLFGLSHWICIEKWSAVVMSNSKLELKASCYHLRSPILSPGIDVTFYRFLIQSFGKHRLSFLALRFYILTPCRSETS
jgi:hypothetical protein